LLTPVSAIATEAMRESRTPCFLSELRPLPEV
jgi:hypothetical protein